MGELSDFWGRLPSSRTAILTPYGGGPSQSVENGRFSCGAPVLPRIYCRRASAGGRVGTRGPGGESGPRPELRVAITTFLPLRVHGSRCRSCLVDREHPQLNTLPSPPVVGLRIIDTILGSGLSEEDPTVLLDRTGG